MQTRTLLYTALLSLFSSTSGAADLGARIASGDSQRLPPALAAGVVDYGSYSWLRATSAQLGQLEAAGISAQVQPDSNLLSFGSQRFDPLQPPPNPPRAARLSESGHTLRLVQLVGPPRQDWLDALDAAGSKVLQYYPHNAYLLWSDNAAAARSANLPFARWQGDFSPDYKYGAELKGRLGPIDNVVVEFYNDGDSEATLAAIAATGVRLIQVFPAQPDRRFLDAIVAADAGQLAALADLPHVVALGYSSPRAYFEDEISAQIVAGNYSPAVPTGYPAFLAQIGLDGSGVTWAVTDSGVDLGHPEFAGRLSGFTYPGCPAGAGLGDDNASGGHGTHVAGIIAGAGTLGPVDAGGFRYAQGIAPAAQIFAQNPICTGSVPWPPAGGWQVLSRNALAAGAIGSNNSWTSGEGNGVGYIATARTFDFMARDGNFDTPTTNEPFIQVFSAGNSGSGVSTITSPKEAKNIISVANSNNTRAGSIEQVATTSSRGPAIDGRTLPTITAPGSQIASTMRRAGASQCGTAIAGTSSNFSFCSGTSMASPHAAGMAVLLTQWWRASHNGATPSIAMLKALMINGAVDLSGPAAIPNNVEGWGRIHLQRSLAAGVNRELIDQTTRLDTAGEVLEYSYGVPDSASGVRISLAWSDAPGAVGASPALVNNLDLEVEADGQTYKGNVFSGGQSATGGIADALNNTENVYLPAGVTSVIVRIRATTLPGDGVPNTGDATDQDFALVCNNCAAEPSFTLAVDRSELSLCHGDDISRPLAVGQILGFNTPVQLSTSGLAAPATVSFSVNPVTPPASTNLQLQVNTLAVGPHTLTVTGSASAVSRELSIPLFVASQLPEAAVTTVPADLATAVAADTSFQWQPSAQAYDYQIAIARNAEFTDLIATATTRDTSYTPTQPLPTNTQLYWRVTARNACGIATAGNSLMVHSGFEDGELPPNAGTVQTFTTVAAPGDCALGATSTVVFSDNMETGAPGWTSGGTANSWALSTAFPHGGSTAYRAVAPALVSDQQLVSPSITLPSVGQGLFLKFWNRQHMEARTAGGCYDGGLLEVAVNGSSTFTAITTGLLTDPYDGALQSGNPVAPAQAWCGDPQAYLNSVVNLAPYAGQQVKFRFRLSSDTSASRADGWNIDDVQVVNCTN